MVKKLDLIVRDLPEFKGILATFTDGKYEYSKVFDSRLHLRNVMHHFVDDATMAFKKTYGKEFIFEYEIK